MPAGINRATDFMSQYLYSEKNVKGSPCIFLSHRRLDKPSVRTLAQYISKAGIDYFLDEEDAELQEADVKEDDEKIVKCIQRGIDSSTHVLCVLSQVALNSIWVPYEIGYGEKGKRDIASLKIKTLSKDRIPSYLRIRNCMLDLMSFNNYLSNIMAPPNAPYGGLFNRGKVDHQTEISNYIKQPCDVVLDSYSTQHPLYDIIQG